MGEQYWQSMWEGTIGFLRTIHGGRVPSEFFNSLPQNPKVMVFLDASSVASAPITN